MTDAELITRLRADVDAHVMTGNGGMRRVEAIRLAADRLTQLSEDNERLREENALMAASLDEEERKCGLSTNGGMWRFWARQLREYHARRAALAQGQKEGD